MFDVYKESSLKAEAQSRRDKGIRRRVTPTSKTPQNWKTFLRHNNSNSELFHFLADWFSEGDMPCLVIVTKEDVYCNRVIALNDYAPCTHAEEAESHIFVHARHAAMNGSKALKVINTTRMCVVVIAISVIKSLNELGLEKNVDCVWPRRKCLMDSSARSDKQNRSRESQWISHSFTFSPDATV